MVQPSGVTQVGPVTFTIPIGTALSDIVDLGWGIPIRFRIPTAWTACDLRIMVSDDGVTAYGPVKNTAGTIIALVVAADDEIVVDRDLLRGFRYMQLRSVNKAGGADVNQAAAREVEVFLEHSRIGG